MSCTSPSLHAIWAYVQIRHSWVQLRDQLPPLAEPQEVSDAARNLASRLYRNKPDEQVCIGVAERAGLLVYGMDRYGLTYEELCDCGDQAIAEVVSRLSCDNRLKGPKRHLDQLARFTLTDDLRELVYLVKLAEIEARTAKVAREFGAEYYKKQTQLVLLWEGESLEFLGKIKAHGPLEAASRRAHERITGLDLRVRLGAPSKKKKKPLEPMTALELLQEPIPA